MKIMNNQQTKYAIYTLAHNIDCPSQSKLIAAIQRVELDSTLAGAPENSIIRDMLYVIMDGLKYGNWPK